MLKREVRVNHDFHARPSTYFVSRAGKYPCKVQVIVDNHITDGKSILGIMTLELRVGSQATLVTEGENEDMAMKELYSIMAGSISKKEWD